MQAEPALIAEGRQTDEPDVSAAEEHEEHLSGPEVRRRAISGAATDAMRGFGIRVLAFFGAAVLARQLSPADFGIVAVGQTFLTFGLFLSDGGIAAALIRRTTAPTRMDLKAFLWLQLSLTIVLVALCAVVMIPFGLIGEVTSVMLLSLPVSAFQVPSTILLERRLNYRTLAVTDLFSTVAYYVWAITTVSLGWGVWGLASAGVVRGVAGTIFLLVVFPPGRMIPWPSLARVRPLLGFGFRYQASNLLALLRDQAINLTVALVGGVSDLGLYNMAYRIYQVPLLLFNSLWRVSFPGMSRLVAAREDMRATVERVLGVVAVAAGVLLAPLAASARDLVPALLGEQWAGAAPVIPPVCLTIMVAAPVSVALVGYLWAIGDAGAVLRSTWLQIPFLLAVLVPLLPVIGVAAVGYGTLAAGAVESVVLIRAARKHLEFTIMPRLGPPTACAIVAALVGGLCSWSMSAPHFLAALTGAVVAAAVYLGLLAIWHRSYLTDAIALGSRGLRGAPRPGKTGSTEGSLSA